MSEQKIKAILDKVVILENGKAADSVMEQTEAGPVLTLAFASPYEPEKAVGFTISIEEQEIFYLTNIMYVVHADIDESLFEKLNELICDINIGMYVGNYVLVKDMKAVVFNIGFYTTDNMTDDAIARQTAQYIDLITVQTGEVGKTIYKFISGQYSFEEALAEANETEEGEV